MGFELSVEFYTKVFGTSPYAPPAGVTIPRDGLQGIAYDQATNRIANAGWNYDAAGNQVRTLSNGVWQRYQYDAANRLVRVKADDNQTIIASYMYGDNNQRLMNEELGQTSVRTYYVAEGLSVIAEYSESGGATNPSWSKSYVYLGNRLLSTMTPNGAGGEAAEYHHPDRLGTRIITNPSTGGWSEQVTLPFGTALAAESSGTPGNRRFTSYNRNSTTGLDYAVNRHYDSQQGRFTQVDPIGMADSGLTTPQGFNLYAYVQSDPVNLVDPTGLYWAVSCSWWALFDVTDAEHPIQISDPYLRCSWYWIPDSPFGAGDPGGGGPGGGGPGVPAPQSPTQGHQGQVKCPPTGDQLANDPTVVSAMRQAWRQSGIGLRDGVRREQGGWIYARDGQIITRRAPSGASSSIDLRNPPRVRGAVLLGTFHTHPGFASQGFDANPSPPDATNALARGVPGLVISEGKQIIPYGPTRRGSNPAFADDPNNSPNNRARGYPGNTVNTQGCKP